MAKATYLIRPRQNRLRLRREDWNRRVCVVIFNDHDVIYDSRRTAGDDPIWMPVKMTYDPNGPV